MRKTKETKPQPIQSEQLDQQERQLAFVFPPGLSRKIKSLQKDIAAKSAGEVLVKAISLLELTLGRKVEIADKTAGRKWEIDEFEGNEKRVEIDGDGPVTV